MMSDVAASGLRVVMGAALFSLLSYAAIRKAVASSPASAVNERLMVYKIRAQRYFKHLWEIRRRALLLRLRFRAYRYWLKASRHKEIIVLALAPAIPLLIYYVGTPIAGAWSNLVRNISYAISEVSSALVAFVDVARPQWLQFVSVLTKLAGGIMVLWAFFLERECDRIEDLLRYDPDTGSRRFGISHEHRVLGFYGEAALNVLPRSEIMRRIITSQMYAIVANSFSLLSAWRNEFPPLKTLDTSVAKQMDAIHSGRVRYTEEAEDETLRETNHDGEYEQVKSDPSFSDRYLTAETFDLIEDVYQTLELSKIEDLTKPQSDDQLNSLYQQMKEGVEDYTSVAIMLFNYWGQYLDLRLTRIKRIRVQLYVAGFLLATVFSPLPEAIAKLFVH